MRKHTLSAFLMTLGLSISPALLFAESAESKDQKIRDAAVRSASQGESMMREGQAALAEKAYRDAFEFQKQLPHEKDKIIAAGYQAGIVAALIDSGNTTAALVELNDAQERGINHHALSRVAAILAPTHPATENYEVAPPVSKVSNTDHQNQVSTAHKHLAEAQIELQYKQLDVASKRSRFSTSEHKLSEARKLLTQAENAHADSKKILALHANHEVPDAANKETIADTQVKNNINKLTAAEDALKSAQNDTSRAKDDAAAREANFAAKEAAFKKSGEAADKAAMENALGNLLAARERVSKTTTAMGAAEMHANNVAKLLRESEHALAVAKADHAKAKRTKSEAELNIRITDQLIKKAEREVGAAINEVDTATKALAVAIDLESLATKTLARVEIEHANALKAAKESTKSDTPSGAKCNSQSAYEHALDSVHKNSHNWRNWHVLAREQYRLGLFPQANASIEKSIRLVHLTASRVPDDEHATLWDDSHTIKLIVGDPNGAQQALDEAQRYRVETAPSAIQFQRQGGRQQTRFDPGMPVSVRSQDFNASQESSVIGSVHSTMPVPGSHCKTCKVK